MTKLDRGTWTEIVALVALPFVVFLASTTTSHFLQGMLYVLPFAILLTVEYSEKQLRARENPALEDERKALIELRSNNAAYQLMRLGALIGSINEASRDERGPFFALFLLSMVAPFVATLWYDRRL